MRAHVISRNFAILSAGQVVSRLFAFAITIHLTRSLQAEGFGIIVFATSVLAYAALIVDCGFNAFGPIEVARIRPDVSHLVRNVVGLRLLLTLAAFGALALFVWLVPLDRITAAILLMYGFSLVISAVQLEWVFSGLENMRLVAISEIVDQAILAAGVFALVHHPEQVVRVPLIYLLAKLGAAVFLIAAFRRQVGSFRPAFDWKQIRRVIPGALPFAGTTVVSMFSHNFDIVLVGLTLGTAAAGVYGAAYRVIWVPTVLITAYHVALRPSLARGYLLGLESVSGLLKRSMRLSTAFAVGVVVGGFLLADEIILFLFGTTYAAAALPFRVLLISFALLVFSRKYRLILTCFNRQLVDLRIMALTAMLNVAGNFLLIPRYGLLGAALATLISELAILLLTYALTRVLIGHVPLGRFLLKPFLCSLVMAAVIVLTPSLHVLARILMAGSAYVVFLFLLKVVSRNEIEVVLAALKPGTVIHD